MLGKSRVKHILANSGTFHGDESPGRFRTKIHTKKQIKSKLGSWWLNQPIRKIISQIEKISKWVHLPQIVKNGENRKYTLEMPPP